ncbi:hypothetical protein KIKIMORA_00890 [Brevundimonas phage vB_BpoS-Kikimora]|uniref:Uncharacterized protein n=1 Tax=Brevundimonas phage vB_BpoS-Kikimora TaxID=2948601 RepID=A0A9E7SKS5_9CAUD|nr:hypothetical protein KIKIMORA_00890 [Brevundimonas phage vB_BpoS-Kikimora]
MKRKFRFRKLEVRLLMKSGAVVRFFASDISATSTGDNNLTALKWDGARGAPLYTRLDDISAIYTRRVPFWTRL